MMVLVQQEMDVNFVMSDYYKVYENNKTDVSNIVDCGFYDEIICKR